LGALAHGETQTVMLKAKANTTGKAVCAVTARAERYADTKATATLNVEPVPALRLEMQGRDAAIDIGAETVYEMRVVNQAGVACPGVRLIVQVPDGLQVVHAKGPTAAVIHTQQVQFDSLQELPGRTEALYVIQARGKAAGDWRLRVEVAGESQQQVLVQEALIRVQEKAPSGMRPMNFGAPR
jgi:hypothetical protein